MTLPLPQLKGANLLTHSRMSCFKTCPRKHLYRYELGIRPKRLARPLRFGGAIHVGLDERAKGKSQDDAIAAATVGYEQLPAWATTDDTVAEWMVERETVAALLSGYFWYWERDDVPPDIRPVEIIETEGSFELPICNPETGRPSTKFRQAGKRDKIVRLASGRIAVAEHKTTGDPIAPDSDYWKKLKLDHQISQYLAATRATGHQAETVLYDVIHKPDIAPRLVAILDDAGLKIVLDAEGRRVTKVNIKKNGEPGAGHGDPIQSGNTEKGWVLQQRRETPAEFGKRLLDDIASRPTTYYARQEIPRLEADLEEFRWELWQQQTAIRESQNRGLWFRNTQACTAMGRCEYLDLCANPIDPTTVPDGFERVTNVHPELETQE